MPTPTMTASQILNARRERSKKLLASLQAELAKQPDLQEHPDVAIYATGSYARLEASKNSDLDVFFVSLDGPAPRIARTLITADVIRVCKQLRLPEFSRDGEFLVFHDLRDMREKLGSPSDDFENYFTARMLLLLESVHLCNEETYKRVIEEVITWYYRDYHDHEESFRPVFLVNDILRFWQTMTLNYEHRRNRPPGDNTAKLKNHIKNLKLKFSRMTTCYSTILLLVKNHEILSPDGLAELVSLTPLARLERIASQVSEGNRILDDMLGLYTWFLEQTARPETDLLAWIGSKQDRNDAFKKARRYRDLMYEMLQRTTSSSDLIRYVVI